jgi:hypothetical protein
MVSNTRVDMHHAVQRALKAQQEDELRTLERDSPEPSESSTNSRTSRPRSPTSATTETSASVFRAICPRRVDLPTPDAEKSPIRCPSTPFDTRSRTDATTESTT